MQTAESVLSRIERACVLIAEAENRDVQKLVCIRVSFGG